MSIKTKTDTLTKCPICLVRHDPRPETHLDLCYCPKCGVPNFFAAGRLIKTPRTNCVWCGLNFEVEKAGGSLVTHRVGEGRNWEFETPRGPLYGMVLTHGEGRP